MTQLPTSSIDQYKRTAYSAHLAHYAPITVHWERRLLSECDAEQQHKHTTRSLSTTQHTLTPHFLPIQTNETSPKPFSGKAFPPSPTQLCQLPPAMLHKILPGVTVLVRSCKSLNLSRKRPVICQYFTHTATENARTPTKRRRLAGKKRSSCLGSSLHRRQLNLNRRGIQT
ncbi:AAEL012322-PA [Aedes aegypti]|uniref:AAEL012322-PA n=1 Tax=Aedes aegypti TaxID=7159 RepID=Q16ME6_AEDAE|nr:AAEL012322-PA [Aedes aegypti]